MPELPTVGEVIEKEVIPGIVERQRQINAAYWHEWTIYFNRRIQRLYLDGHSMEEASWLVAEEAKTIIPEMNARMRAELAALPGGETA